MHTAWARIGGRWTAAVVACALGVCGCGSSGGTAGSATNGIHASVSRYLSALAKRDAAGACTVITNRYWSATANELVAQRGDQSFANLPSQPCREGLARVLTRSTASRTPVRFALSNIHTRGHTATAHLTLGATRSDGTIVNARFVRGSGGNWQIDCCTGTQLAHQGTATYRVPSGAMLPTLRTGQIVTVDNATMRARPPRLGEIVVLNPPSGFDASVPRCGARGEGLGHPRMCGAPTGSPAAERLIKRVVGLPGDRLAMRNGHVIRNGRPEPDGYIKPCAPVNSLVCNFPQPIVVPAGDYFVLGDNRAESDDSRFWGPVKRAWITGLVTR
jgi:signal peptidase I